VSDLDPLATHADEAADAPPPRVAISAPKPRDRDCARVPVDYVDAVRRAGGEPYVVSTYEICEDDRRPEGLEVIDGLEVTETSDLEGASGLVLTGGGDVDPAFYGQQPHPRSYNISRRRDSFEFNLLEEALSRDMPVLAICRGSQVLNVARGGDLVQHLPEEVGHDRHRHTPGEFSDHDVTLAPDSRLGAVLGEHSPVKSHHHQGYGRIGEGLREVAWADDGVVEGLEDPDKRFALGVLWHPEEDPEDHVIPAFIEQARS
jgi:putative glutamine amidotransferase